MIKTDSDGQVEWENKFNQSVHAFGYAVQQTYDGGYLMTGHSYDNNLCWGFPSYNVIIIKVDSSGSELWRSVPMGTIWGCMTYAAHSIRETSDSGFVLCGMSYVESICKTAADPDTGLPYTSNMILYKGDKDGNYVWSHEIYGSYKTMGTFGTETSDGGYIFTAYQGIDYATDGDALVIKTNSVGTLVGLDERSSDELGVAVYPNPASAFIILDPIATAKYSFSIYDGLGRIVLSGNEMKGKLKVNISTLTYGMYHLRLGSDHHLMSKKIIITK
ncbi:MAG: hypothetical protein COB85_08515 [Bacteroidetes bacterium]|nr:MAG: hypothetical protein COB85_08515 [Bacteroidota bacterium]